MRVNMLRFALVSVFAVTAMTISLNAQIGAGLSTGKYGTFNVYSAHSLEPGYLQFYNQGRVFGLAGKSGYANIRGVNLWDASNKMTFAYGIVRHLDLLLSVSTYQDLNIRNVRDTRNRILGDIYMVVRTGGYEMADGKVALAAAVPLKIPTGKYYNIPFEVYRSETFEFGFLGMASFYGNPYYKDQSYIINFNIGFWNHNDNGRWISPIKNGENIGGKSNVNAMHVQYGLGAIIPMSKINLMLDLYGINYITEPVKGVYSREPFIYVTPGLKYNIRPWINIGTYMDVLIVGTNDKTIYNNAYGVLAPGVPASNTSSTKSLANYATWRLGVTMGINILPVSFSSGATDSRRKRFLNQLLDEERGSAKAASQLEKLKNVRINAEKELEKIRKELEQGSGGEEK